MVSLAISLGMVTLHSKREHEKIEGGREDSRSTRIIMIMINIPVL